MALPTAPTLDTAVQAMLGILSAYLPAPTGPLPDPTISVTDLTERTVGMGNYRGSDSRGAFPALSLKGIRVDALTSFQLWAPGPAQVDGGVSALASKLAGDADKLWSQGFLKFALDASPPAEIIPTLNAWRKHADYRVLFEYAYSDTDDADSLIARIPIAVDGETTTVTDEMTRWDDGAAPALVVGAPIEIGSLSLLLFVAGAAPSGSVTLTRTFDAASAPPVVHPNLAAFLAAVAGPAPAERNSSVAFASFGDFVAAATADGTAFAMGDWNGDNTPDMYQPLRIPLGAGIALSEPADRFEVSYQTPALDRVAVVYLRAARGE